VNFTFSLSELFIGFGGLIAVIITMAFIIRTKKNNLAGIWLIGFCLANVFVIFIKILYSMGLILEIPHLLRWKFPIGLSRPVFFFLFIFYLYKGYNKIKWQHLFHFLPVLAVLIYFIPFFLTSASEKISWLNGEHLLQNANLPSWYYYFITIYSAVYLVSSFLIFIKNRHLTLKLLNTFITIVFGTTVIFLLIALLNTYSAGSVELNNFMYLVLSSGFIIGSIIILVSQTDLNIGQNIKYQSSNITQKRSQAIFDKAQKIVDLEKLYKDPQLKLTDLADKIKIPSYLLSHAINQQTGKSFNDFINQMRVDEAADLISNDDYQHLTLEAIGYEVGFNSRSSFYSAFKKIKTRTPASFKKAVTI